METCVSIFAMSNISCGRSLDLFLELHILRLCCFSIYSLSCVWCDLCCSTVSSLRCISCDVRISLAL